MVVSPWSRLRFGPKFTFVGTLAKKVYPERWWRFLHGQAPHGRPWFVPASFACSAGRRAWANSTFLEELSLPQGRTNDPWPRQSRRPGGTEWGIVQIPPIRKGGSVLAFISWGRAATTVACSSFGFSCNWWSSPARACLRFATEGATSIATSVACEIPQALKRLVWASVPEGKKRTCFFTT